MKLAALLSAPALVAAVPKGCDVCAGERDEYCEIWPGAALCEDPCGFEWDAETMQCWEVGTKPTFAFASSTTAAPIIGGSGKFKYQYMPDLVKAPAGAAFVNCHGLSVDADENIILTYSNDGKDPHCLAKWKPDGTGGEFLAGAGNSPGLCSGTPHGLKITTEADGTARCTANFLRLFNLC